LVSAYKENLMAADTATAVPEGSDGSKTKDPKGVLAA